MKKSTKAQLRAKAEKVLLSKSKNQQKDNRPPNELVHELQVHQIELEMQNDELRGIQAHLEEISAKYQDLYEFAPVGYFIFDEEWIILEANLTGARMLGTTRSQTIKKPLHAFIHPEFQDAFHLYCRRLWKSENLETCELKLKNNIFVSLESNYVLDDRRGRTGQVRSIFIDITERKIVEIERKRAEDLLRNEKLRLEIAQESAQAGTFEWDIQGNKTIWSDQLKALYGFAPGEFKGFENFSSRVHPDDLRKSKKAIAESLKTGKYDSDFRVIWQDGSLHWLAARGRVVYNEHGLPILMTGINMDITERKRVEEALRESEEKFRTLANASPNAIIVYRGDKFLFVNPAAESLFGGTREELLSIDFINLIHPDYRDITIDWIRARMGGEQKPARYEIKVVTKSGEEKWMELSSRLIQYEGTSAGLVLGIDITDRKRAEEELRKAKDELENKVRERTSQLAEINNSLLAEIEGRKRTEHMLRAARKNLRAMAAEIVMADERSRQHFAADLHDTVIQTMGAAKMRSQLIQDEIPKKVSKDFRELQEFISQSITQARFIMAEMSPPVLNELGFIPAMEWLTEQIENQHGINIEIKATDGFMPIQHEIQVLLFQATRELLMNVVKHAHADKTLVKISAKRQKVRIEVIDDGKGFDKRQAFRTDVSSGGFGLYSIRERIRHFGGYLFIKSEAGKGTRVVVTAPHNRGGAIATKLKKRAGSL